MLSFEPSRFPYNRRCFLKVNKRGPGSLVEKPVPAFRVKKWGVYFEGVHTTKKLVPRISLAVQPMYKQAPCRLSICNKRKLMTTNFLFIPAILNNSVHKQRKGAYKLRVLHWLRHVPRKGWVCTALKTLAVRSCVLSENNNWELRSSLRGFNDPIISA